MTREDLIRHAEETYGVEPAHLWEKFPDTFVFRHQTNGKWFAVVMDVERKKLGLPSEGKVWLMDTKCGPILSGSFQGQPGVVRAWHMNKTQWIGVLLDGSAADETVKELLDISYELTMPSRKAAK